MKPIYNTIIAASLFLLNHVAFGQENSFQKPRTVACLELDKIFTTETYATGEVIMKKLICILLFSCLYTIQFNSPNQPR